MTLSQLGMEYLQEAARLKLRANELKEQKKRCTDEQEEIRLNARIYYLMREIADCQEWGLHLLTYYSEGESQAI